MSVEHVEQWEAEAGEHLDGVIAAILGIFTFAWLSKVLTMNMKHGQGGGGGGASH